MPIFEFRCIECGNFFEKLFLRADEKADIECPACGSVSFERVVSRINYAMGPGQGGKQPNISAKSCGSGNQCMTLDLPGPTK
ncbi:MAG: zinc ribbon domain-containing protein [Deltaproteobacteria bacterium]|nr:zinc ribbon domain-containing protein [Deltaproteobacteria bacterium]